MKPLLLTSLFSAATCAFAAPPSPAESTAMAAKPVVTAKPVVPKIGVGQPLTAKPATPKAMSAPALTTKPMAAKPMAAKPMAAPAMMPATAKIEKLANGVNFVTRPDALAPRAAISLVIRAGAADETPETAGWRRLLVSAMLRSAPNGYLNEITGLVETPAGEGLPRAAEKAGGNIGASVGDDFIEIYVAGDANRASELLDLALALWQKPRLSEADFKVARERARGQVDADDLDTAGKTQAALRSQLFRDARGELSAYGLPDYGTDASLANLTDEKLRSLFKTKLASARVTVAATGNFDAAILRQKLLGLPAISQREAAPPTFAAPKTSSPALVVRELPVPSAWVFVSYPLAGNTSADAPALRVLAAALGDSSKARLPNRLLKNQPIGSNPAVSSVAAQFVPRRYAGEIVLFAQTSPQNVEKVKNALLDEMRKTRDVPLSPLELESAKTYARGSWSVERQNLRDRAFQTALSPALGGPLDTQFPARVGAVSSAEVQRVAKKYLGAYAVALVMPAEGNS